jgi:hypothetical protein
MQKSVAFILGALIAVGLATAGFFAARAVEISKRFERYVSVKGLSEREVPADLAIWPIKFRLLDNDLGALQQRLQATRAIIREFLAGAGFTDAEISVTPPDITDLRASMKLDGERMPEQRYQADAAVLLRTAKVDAVVAALGEADKLVKRGIAIRGSEEYNSKVEFLFVNINAIKPGMIEEATANARKAAEQFAKDSASRVGAIRRATQGAIQVNDRDSSSPHRKIVRVVTAVDYFVD